MNSTDSRDGDTSSSASGQGASELQDADDLAVGQIVGGSYEIIDFLGQGAMGVVYLAKHVSMPVQYALKILTADKVNEVSVIRFQNEAQAIAKLSHPNIVSIYNFGLHRGTLPFCVMEYLSGRDLLDIVQSDGPLPVEHALALFIEACAGLGFAHRKGILHRDIKPANLFVLDKPDVSGARLKVVDFGIVKFAEELKPDAQKLTAMGLVCGSPCYMSPEQACAQKVDPRADVYSLGCSLFEVLTGKLPFLGRSPSETMMMHASAPVPKLASKGLGREYPEDLDTLIAKMLAKEPMNRYQNMDAVAQDLRNILEKKPLGTPPPLPLDAANKRATIAPGAAGERRTISPGQSTLLSQSRGAGRPINQAAGEETGETKAYLEEQARGLRSKMIIISASALVLILVVGGLLWPKGPTASDLPKTELSAPLPEIVGQTQQAARKLEAELDGKDDLQQDLKDASQIAGGAFSDSKPVVGQSGRQSFYTRKDASASRGQVEFHFPEAGTVLPPAWIGTSLEDRSPAVGNILFPKEAQLFLMPSSSMLSYPGFVSGFRPGEIFAVFVPPGYASDKLVEMAAATPGVKEFTIAGCRQVTAKVVPSLDRLTSATTFNGFDTAIDGADYARANLWKHLNMIVLGKCRNLHPLLAKLSGSTKLEALNVASSNLTSADYNLISTLPNLNSLVISCNRLNAADLRALSKLPRLRELWLVSVVLKDGSMARELLKFPSLKRVIVDKAHFSDQDIEYLKQHPPRFSIEFKAKQS